MNVVKELQNEDSEGIWLRKREYEYIQRDIRHAGRAHTVDGEAFDLIELSREESNRPPDPHSIHTLDCSSRCGKPTHYLGHSRLFAGLLEMLRNAKKC